MMTDLLYVALGLVHFLLLVALITFYCAHMRFPWREWPLMVFLLLWGALVATGCLVSLFDALGSLSSYIVTSFAGLGFTLLAHRASCGPPLKTPYAKIEYPVFALISSPKMRRLLWWLLVGTLAIELLIHLVICFSFYPVNADSLNYRLPRVFWYVSHGNLLHPFESIDKRLTFYPLDGILLYVPLALYGVSSIFFALPSLFMWLTLGYASYRFARALQAERLIALFATWLVVMTPSILVEASSTNDEILTAAPLVAGLFFAWRWLVTGAGHYLFLAALGVGLCIGTKLHVFFLIPVVLLGLLWFIWFLGRRKESWRLWLPETSMPSLLLSLLVLGLMGPLFLLLNYWSSGQFYFLKDTAKQVLNLGISLQDAMQNFLIYAASIILAPIADLNIFQSFHLREVTNRELNSLFLPLLQPFVSNDPQYYHLTYKFQGVIIPTSVLLVEYGLWPGFAWMLWPLQAVALLRQKFTLRPFFLMIAATPVIWLIVWSCVTLYMEGVPTYFAFYLMCAAPAMSLCFARAQTPRGNKRRWIVIAFVVLTNLVIDGNVAINNTFRGLWHFTEDQPWPYDWLRFEQPIIDEIRRADKIQIPVTHGKVYYFAFMHWNPRALYYSPYQPAPNLPDILHVLSTPSESLYGFMPMRIPDKPTPGLTYLGHIRGVDREAIFAFGNNVASRWLEDSNFISLHATITPKGRLYNMAIDPVVAGLNPGDQLEFKFEIATGDGKTIYERPWDSSPVLNVDLPKDPASTIYFLKISARSRLHPDEAVEQVFTPGGKGAWCIRREKETSCLDDQE
jgi:hypothetical protein